MKQTGIKFKAVTFSGRKKKSILRISRRDLLTKAKNNGVTDSHVWNIYKLKVTLRFFISAAKHSLLSHSCRMCIWIRDGSVAYWCRGWLTSWSGWASGLVGSPRPVCSHGGSCWHWRPRLGDPESSSPHQGGSAPSSYTQTGREK